MGKLLLLVVLAFVGFLLIKGLKNPRRNGADPKGAKPKASRGEAAVERMVTCAHCGVNLPESESLRSGERHFCSEEHRRAMR